MKTVLFLVVAAGLIGFGGYRQFVMPSVSGVDKARCLSIVSEQYGSNPESAAELSQSCDDPGMIAMMDARSQSAGADQAAQSIASVNQNDIVSTLINCALIGAGIGALGAAFGARRLT